MARPLPLSLLAAGFVPTLLVVLMWIAATLGLPFPYLGPLGVAWLMVSTTVATLLVGLARLEAGRVMEESPGVAQVLQDLQDAEEVARRTEDAVVELTRVLEERGLATISTEEE